MNTDKLKAWLCLKSAPGMGLKTAQQVLESYPDPRGFIGKADHPLYREEWISAKARDAMRSGESSANLEQITKLMQYYEIGFTCLTDPEYPACLKATFSPPLIIYTRGDLEKAMDGINLAVVGTRKPSAYGKEMTLKLIQAVAERGVGIISGLAMGIDTVAHQAALAAGGRTIAVLAGGLESIYPPQNREVANSIIKNGALISEYEPGSKMERWNFPARNRIISALATAVFIAEGPMSSGAMLTGKFALEQNRDIFALPGNINNVNAQGPNYLIKNGAALITTPEDILERLGLEFAPPSQIELFPELSTEEETIYKRLQLEAKEVGFDELLITTGYSFGRISVIMLNLELKGLVAKAGNGNYLVI